MSTEQNKAVVRRFIESTLNDLDAALVDELFAPDYVNHLVPGGREGFKQFFTMLRSAFPDLKMHNSIEYLIAEGDQEATGSDLSEYRLANGKIVEDWPPSGTAALMQQVGVTLPSG